MTLNLTPNEKFEKLYTQLNLKQKEAVSAIEGPVMVIAGPGTGKTQILSARIAKILLETDSLPHNILCLTYTEAGVVAMRKRLLSFIGPDAYKVNICTFHAFCNDVIQENLSLFEKTTMDPVSDLERIELFKELIDTLPKDHLLKRYRGDVYFDITHLQHLFSTMKREGWTPSFIQSKADAYLKDLPLREEYITKRATKEFKKGELRTDKIKLQQERMDKLMAAVNEFDRMQTIMRKHNRYDFDDMIIWVIGAFEAHPALLQRYQEQYLYILADEYQDTSGTQNKLIQLLIGYWDTPNVFVVGDDDQSIYRFQGANIENLVQFADSYPDDLRTVMLTENYRSVQPILDLSKSLIDRNKERLVRKLPNLSKTLVAANQTINHLNIQPAIKTYKTQHEEMMGVALAIQQLLQQQVPAGKIGVIYKEHKYGEALAQYCQLLEIPVYSKRNINVLDQPLIRQLLLVLEYIAAEHDIPYGGDEMLFEILHFNWFNIPAMEIARLSVAVAEEGFKGGKTSLRRKLAEKVQLQDRTLFSKPVEKGMILAHTSLEQLISDASNVTVQTLVENIIRTTGLLTRVMQLPEKHSQLQLLTIFFDFVKEETRRKPDMQLEQLVNMMSLMKKEGISLPMTQVSGSDKGVNLMTAHGSKGLEFEYVFIVGCHAGNWEKKRKPSTIFSFPDTMFDTGAAAAEEEELRRLFYVAITRAEKHLYISYSTFNNEGKELEASMFIAELLDGTSLEIENVLLSEDQKATFALLQFEAPPAPTIALLEKDFVQQLLDKFVMNVTALNNYLACPLKFYFQNLVRVPSGKSEATEFGSAVHHALQRLFEKMQEGKQNRFDSSEAFIGDFEWFMKRHRENFTKEQFARRMEYGQKILLEYYNTYIHRWSTVVAIERNIRNVVVGGVPLKGKIDKMEFDGKQVNVVDYKTGDVQKAIKKLESPSDKNPDGGDYWRQAVFYKLLVDGYEGKDWEVVSAEFDFIEPDKTKGYQKQKLLITEADTRIVKEQIKRVWGSIQQHDFYTGCGKEDCQWCAFVQNNQLAISLNELAGDESGEE